MKRNKTVLIRNEQKKDYQRVEEITREAFYNLYFPGCNEHYLVHTMRQHKDFIKELDFVMEQDNQIIGNIMYTKAKLVSSSGQEKEILTFGPLSIKPEYQRYGYGKQLMEHSFKEALKLGYDVIVIFGNPSNYISSGFKCSKKFNVGLGNEIYPTGMMVKELKPGVLDNEKWTYDGSPAMNIDEQEAQRFDSNLEPMEKKYKPSQDEFYIIANSLVQ